jgi:hypothetical protein
VAHWIAVTVNELACLQMKLIFTIVLLDILKLPPTHLLCHLLQILNYENIYDKVSHITWDMQQFITEIT